MKKTHGIKAEKGSYHSEAVTAPIILVVGEHNVLLFWVVKLALPISHNSAPECMSADSQRMIFHSSAVAGLTFCKALNLELISIGLQGVKHLTAAVYYLHKGTDMQDFPSCSLARMNSVQKERRTNIQILLHLKLTEARLSSAVACELFLELCSLSETILIFSVIFFSICCSTPNREKWALT